MPSTYTTNLGIEKIGTGEQSGTWGTTTNTNLDLIDQAVNGVVQVTLAAAGTSGSPNSLPINDGTASDGRNKFIEFTDGGDLGATAFVQLTPNDAEKVAFFRNSLTGGRSVILFQGTYNASNDFEIPSGADVVLKFDGAGAGATVTQVFEDLTISAVTLSSGVTASSILDEDNMASDSATALATQQSIKAYVDSQVATVDTLAEILANGNTSGATDLVIDSGQVLTTNTINETTAASGVTIESVLLKDDGVNATNLEITNLKANDGTSAGSIANSTGVVTLASSVLTTTDINGGTIDGVTIGGASAGAGTFTTLTANGNVVLGDAATDTVTVTADIASDLIPSADGSFDLGASGAEWQDLFIDGTANIDSLVADTADINAGTIDGTVIGGSSAAAGTFTTFTSTGIDDNATSTAITIDASENVGIGTSSPASSRMTIVGGSLPTADNGSTNALQFAAGVTGRRASSNTVAFMGTFSNTSSIEVGAGLNGSGLSMHGSTASANANSVILYTAQTERMRIDSSGKVGIGTSSPAAKLSVLGNAFIGPANPYDNNAQGSQLYVLGPNTNSSTAQINIGTPGSVAGTSASPYNLNLSFRGYRGAERARISAADETVITGASYLRFYTNGPSGFLEHMRMDSSGHLIVPEGITLGTAVGTYNAANTLDDYEEGTFTLSASAGTLTYLYGSTSTYTKIGNRVIIDLGQLQLTGVPNNTTLFALSGLPFTTEGQSAIPTGFVNRSFGTTNGDMWFNMYVESNQIFIGKRNSDYLIRNEDITGATIEFSAGGSAYRTS